MANILAVDDDPAILALVANALKSEGHSIKCISQVTDELQKQLPSFDLILLDVMMPGMDGFTFCRSIRELVDCPILFLTAKSEEEDAAFGLSLGADDYIRKPFSIVELRARVRAHLRREQREKHVSFTVSGVHFYLRKREARAGEERLPFTKSEYEIALLLAKNHGQIFSREQIYENVFGFDGESDSSAITEHIKNIRKKLAACDLAPIETIWGIGYRWN